MTLTVASPPAEVAAAIITESRTRGHSRDESIAELSTAKQESGLRMVKHPTADWWGYYQQDSSYPNRRDPLGNIRGFMDRLDQKRASPGASRDPFKNIFWLQQRPSDPSADAAFSRGRKAYYDEIRRHIDWATDIYDRLTGGHVPQDGNRPPFNEFANWTSNNNARGNTKIDLFLLHTQEGGGGNAAAEDLSKFIRSTEGGGGAVSYHYTISQASDGGVTVVDCVDSDFASWSVLSANNRSINLCFAGSRAAWSRADWLKQGNAIDVAAYLAVQDAKKYDFPPRVIPPPYKTDPPGIADHNYVTKHLGDGTHTDVGPNFPWDVFTTAVNKYASGLTPEVPVVVERLPQDLTDRKVLDDIWIQLLGPSGKGWPQLGQNAKGQNLTLVDAIAELKAGK